MKPRLLFIGNMLGRRAGFVTTQGQIVADLFAGEGFDVVSTSSRINRLVRLADILWTIIKQRNKTDLAVLEVYSGPNMVIADAVTKLCQFLRLPVVAVLHGGNLPAFTRRRQKWCARVLRRASRLIAPSEYLATELGHLGLDISVIPNVVNLTDCPFVHRRQAQPELIWMRSFHENYNPELAVRVVARLKAEVPNIRLTMAGNDKGLLAATKDLADRLGVSGNIHFAGFIGTAEKIKLFSAASVFLNTNRIDNMPVSVVEAAAFGLPIVATKVGGIPYLLADGETALLVPDDGADEMAVAVRKLLATPELVGHLSANGRRLAEKSAWPDVRQQWLEVFGEVSPAATATAGKTCPQV